MRVRMLCGPYAGQVQEVPYHVGTNLLSTGFAEEESREEATEPAEAVVIPETAALAVPEKAVKSVAKKKGKK